MSGTRTGAHQTANRRAALGRGFALPFALGTAGWLLTRVLMAATVPAFPGAEGFGAKAVGGRGGRVIEVTNLNDRGPGSLRAACEAKGPRIVVFRLGGTITLKTGIRIIHPYITLAGQTAPGGGITLRNDPSNRSPALTIGYKKGGRKPYGNNGTGHDVIIRYIRSRPGPATQKNTSVDALLIVEGHNIIIDHCSFSWASNKVFNVWYNPHDITVQWCIISEGLYKSTDRRGPLSMGMLLGDQVTRVSAHHNLFAHNLQRNPRLQGGLIDFVNNVSYNAGTYTAWFFPNRGQQISVNYVGNFIKKGPSYGRPYGIKPKAHPHIPEVVISSGRPVFAYVRGNIGYNRPTDRIDDWAIVGSWGGPRPKEMKKLYKTDKRHDMPPVTTTSAVVAYERVLAGSGCAFPRRDAVDRRVVDDVRNGTGKIINHPSEVGGWPKLAAGIPPADSDHDGMPDAWERKHGLNPKNPADGGKDRDGDGYTNVEEYINGLVAHPHAPAVRSGRTGRRLKPDGSRKAVGGP